MKTGNTVWRHLSPLLAILFWVGVWWVIALLVGKPLLLPSPPAVLSALGRLLTTAAFWQSIGATLLRVTAGLSAALLLGVLLAILSDANRYAHDLISPLMGVLKSTPVVSVIFLFLIFLGKGIVPITVSFAMALPIVWSTVLSTLGEDGAELAEMATVFGVPKGKQFLTLKLPLVLKSTATACRSAVGLGLRAGVAAEVLSLPKNAIGTAIFEANELLLPPELFAYTLTVILLGALLEWLLLLLFPTDKSCEVTR